MEAGQSPEHVARTGGFFFRVWRSDPQPWHWRVRIEVVGTGEWGEFDSMPEALWFMREHMTVEEDGESELPPFATISDEAPLDEGEE